MIVIILTRLPPHRGRCQLERECRCRSVEFQQQIFVPQLWLGAVDCQDHLQSAHSITMEWLSIRSRALEKKFIIIGKITDIIAASMGINLYLKDNFYSMNFKAMVHLFRNRMTTILDHNLALTTERERSIKFQSKSCPNLKIIDTYHSVPVVRSHVSSFGIVPCSFTVRHSVEVGMSSLEKKLAKINHNSYNIYRVSNLIRELATLGHISHNWHLVCLGHGAEKDGILVAS